MTLRYGSLFSGYGGLDLGLQSVLGGTTAWFSEFDKHPSAILAHHWPDIPNHGDITKIDFTKVEPVDVLTGGFPCQDVSHAGRRAGLIRDGEGRTRSGLWGEMLRAITELRPRLVVAENVRGLLSAAADSDVEPCPWCLGDASGEPDMRALGAVLADLADVGYDAWWVGLRAADVGAPHGRFRVFIFAWPAADAERIAWRLAEDVGRIQRPRAADRETATDADLSGLGRLGRLEPLVRDTDGCGRADGPRAAGEPEAHGLTLLPTPRSSDSNGAGEHGTGGPDLRTVVDLLPTPTVNDAGNVGGASQFDRNTVPLSHALLPTPRATDGTKGGPNQRGSSGDLMLPSAVQLLQTPSVADGLGGHLTRSGERGAELLLPGQAKDMGVNGWGDYGAAIARWEAVIGRPAPAPTEPGPKGSPRLSAAFVEWLMGLPAGHVTDVDIPRNAQLKALGNGVVPQQAAAAARWWLAQIQETAA